MKSETENKSLYSKLSDYESTSAELQKSLEVEKEGRQQSADTLGKELGEVKGQLKEMQEKSEENENKNQVKNFQISDVER